MIIFFILKFKDIKINKVYFLKLNYDICHINYKKKKMKDLLDILKYVLPSIIVMGTSYYLLKLFFNQEEKKRDTEIKKAGYNVITPIRLQAYERVVLFIERISPESLIFRVFKQEYTAMQLQTALIINIRDEFEHNFSQQVYLSTVSWELVRNAKEDMIKLINTAASKLNDNATATDLSQKIFELSLGEKLATKKALECLKNEIRTNF